MANWSNPGDPRAAPRALPRAVGSWRPNGLELWLWGPLRRFCRWEVALAIGWEHKGFKGTEFRCDCSRHGLLVMLGAGKTLSRDSSLEVGSSFSNNYLEVWSGSSQLAQGNTLDILSWSWTQCQTAIISNGVFSARLGWGWLEVL